MRLLEVLFQGPPAHGSGGGKNDGVLFLVLLVTGVPNILELTTVE